MKKINLNQLFMSWNEKQKPRRIGRYAVMLIMLLTLGVGQMWADAFWPYAGFYEVYMTYSYSGNNSNYTFYSSDNNSSQSVDLGTLTADFKVNSLYLKCYKNTGDWSQYGNLCGGLMIYNTGSGDNEYQPTWTITDKNTWHNDFQAHLYEYSKTSCNKVIASYNSGASGSYTAKLAFKMWGSDDNSSNCDDNWWISNNSNNYKFIYKIAPPAISSLSVSESGSLSGTGAEDDPYIIPYNGTLTLTVNGSKGRTDANSTIKYWKNSGDKQNSNVLTVTGITSTSLQSVAVHAQCINNSDGTLVGTESNTTIYYIAGYTITPVAKYTTDGSTYTAGTTGGTVTINGSSSAIGVVKDATYSIVATPASGYCVEEIKVGETVAWEQANDNNRQTAAKTISTYTATADKTVTVKFARIQNITLHIHDGGVGGLVLQNATPKVGAHTVSLPNTTLTSEGNGWYYHTFDNVTSVTVLNVACSNTGAAAVANAGQPISTYTLSQTEYFSAIHSQNDGSSSICNVLGVSYTNQSYSIGSPAITLNPTYTLAPSGSPTYSWSVTSQPVGGAYSLSATNVASPTFSSTVEGTYTLKVQVTTGGCTKSTSFDVEVANGVPDPEISGATFVTNPILSNAHLQISITYANIPAEGCYIRLKQGAGYWNDENNSPWTALSSGSGSMTFTTNNTNVPTGTWTIELYNNAKNSLLSSTNVTGSLSVLTAQTITISAGANGSVSPTTVYAGSGYRSESFTATPNDHYHFVNWSNNNSSNVTVNDVNSATTYVSTAAAAATITANFAGDQYSITYKDQGDAAFSGNHVDSPSSHPTTHTYGAATTLNSATKTGYSFGGWFTTSACTGVAVNSLGATAYTANITLYAKWIENMTDVTLAASPAGGGTFTIGGAAATETTAGRTTTRSVTAVPGNGYYLTGTIWSKSNNNITLSSTTTNPTTVTGCGTVSTSSTLTATFKPIWYLKGAFNSWGTTHPFVFTSATSGYVDVELDGNSTFKLYDEQNDQWYGSQYGIEKGVRLSTELWSDNGNDCPITINGLAGTYRFTLDISSGKVVTVTPPTFNQIRFYSARVDGDLTNTYNFENTGSSPWTKSVNLTAGTTYWFKVIEDGTYLGNDGTMTRANCTNWTMSDANNCGITADVTGSYTFSYVPSTDKLTVTYPTAYTVTYGVGTNYTSMGSVSTSPSITSGNYVIAGTNITFTATPNLGYKFVGWYSNAACTGDAVSMNASYTIASLAANTTLYAKYELLTLYMNSDINNWASEINLTHTTENAAIYTYTGTLNANPTNDAPTYESGWHFEYCYDAARTQKAYQYTSVQTTYSGSSIDGVNTYSGAHTIQFGLTRKSDVTITLTLQTAPTKPTVSIAADPYYTITYGVPTHGSYTIQVGSAAAVGASTESTAGKTITLVPSASTGYHFDSWTVTKAGGGTVTVTSNQFTMPSDDVTIAATFLPTSYDVTLKPNGATTGSDQVVRATFDAAMPTTTKTSAALAAPTKTGYTLQGFYQNSDGTGTKYYNANMTSANAWNQAGDANVWAKWQANPYVVTLDVDEVNQGTISGATTRQDVTYDGATTTVPNRPTAANGYALDGYYTNHAGEGVKVINADGTWIASVAGYTDGSKHWVHDGSVTLYAYYKKAEITNIAFGAGAVVENGSTVTVTATISPTPTGTTTVCWRILYDNGSALDPQPAFDPVTAQGNSVSFTAPAASGMYKVEAVLHTGSGCAGTDLSTLTADFQVAGSHTVTVAYKHSGTDIAASTSVTGRPLDWSDPITAPDIFGYTFYHWTAGDGITLSEDGESDLGKDESSSATIYIKAIYDGTLTANYTPKKLIYFKNTLGWENVYVNFYMSDYWNDSKGSGNNGVPVQNRTMTRLGETDIWYYDYGSDNFTGYTNTKPTNYVSFTNESRSSAENFWGSGTGILVSYPARRADDLVDKSGETGFYESTPMFVPLAGQTPITKNESGGGKALYYNSGYWTKYLPGTGYTLEIYNAAGNSKLKEMDFSSADELMPMKAVADLEANTTYKFQIKRHGDVYLGNSGTMTYTNHGQSTPWEMTNSGFSMCRITTTAAGDYTFNFSYSANASNQYRLRISVDYPVGNGDYRLVYTDGTRSGRLKPSAIVQKENDGSAIVSFFVRHNQTPVLRIQQATVDGAGNITWNEYPTSGTPTNQITGAIASAITKDTVYNFNLSMNGSGALSVAGVEYYSGNYYIRTDAANSKWDNYRTDPDHLMNYSEYLKSDVGYSHYYTHWVNKDDVGRKNVKFVIANDYSPCISDTLAREEASGTWANIATWMEEGGDLKRSANVRFMWDIETNNIARAYIDGAQGPGSDIFLRMLSDDHKIKQDEVEKTSVAFSDNGNWIYEANVSAQPNAQIKLKSTWGTGGSAIEQYFKGSSSETDALIGGSTTDWYDIRVIYDFKTNRLVASYVPSTGTISTDIEINADVMFVREHQGDIAQLTFIGSGAISDIKTAYGVMRFNKWTINNKAKAEPHSPLSPELSRFERDLFYISFPFRVNLEEVFGFGTYGTHWIIEEYDGAARAAKGFWADTETFWRFITNRKGKFLEPNVGYLLALDLDMLGEGSDVWANTEQVELYFPSYGTMPNITKSTVTHNIPEHTCTIGPRFAGGDDRRVKDSHWNIMSVPTYINTDDVTFTNTDWITAGDGQLGPNFLYTVNWSDNSLTATSGVGYTYKAMHAYIVQYCGNVTWSTSVSPATAPRRNPDAPKDAEYRLELRQNEQTIDQTFVRMSDDEHVTTGFDFNYDLSKEFNKNKANIYTMVSTMIDGDLSVTQTAGNTLPMSEQTTIIPVGVKIATDGEYTFAISDGTSGVGVTLIDNVLNTRTNLGLTDYTVNLNAGTIDGRFILEISPVQGTITSLEPISDEGLEISGARKVIIDQKMYIIRGNEIFDARGAKVK